jgi:asparagine synthase (glutamine-hydrolysing)
MKGITEKHLLRKSLARHLPEGIAKRTKQPYRAPDAKCFLKNDALDYVNEMLSTRSISQNGYFDSAAVAKLVAKCRQDGAIGQRENMALVGILSLQLMHCVFIEAAGTAPSFERRNVCRV